MKDEDARLGLMFKRENKTFESEDKSGRIRMKIIVKER